MSDNSSIPETGFLRLPEVLKLIPYGRSTWWAGVKSGRFPKQVKLGPCTSAWRAEDIKALIAELSAQSALPVHSGCKMVGKCPQSLGKNVGYSVRVEVSDDSQSGLFDEKQIFQSENYNDHSATASGGVEEEMI